MAPYTRTTEDQLHTHIKYWQYHALQVYTSDTQCPTHTHRYDRIREAFNDDNDDVVLCRKDIETAQCIKLNTKFGFATFPAGTG